MEIEALLTKAPPAAGLVAVGAEDVDVDPTVPHFFTGAASTGAPPPAAAFAAAASRFLRIISANPPPAPPLN